MDDGEGSYAAVARALNDAYGLAGAAALDRRVIERWSRRRTLNAAGQPPPEPEAYSPESRGHGHPHVIFRLADWVEWARPGVQAPGSTRTVPRYETLDARRGRYADRCPACGNPGGRRLNAGLCDACLQDALRAEAGRIAR